MLLLILDFETTGSSPDTAQPIELGGILYSVEEQSTLAQASTLIPAPSNPCQNINRISAGASQAAEEIYRATLQLLEQWIERADYLVAHNAGFDRRWLGTHGMPAAETPWLCTMEDFVWPAAAKQRSSLVNLALEHGIGVSSAHRALTDCQLIAALFDRMEDLPTMVQAAIARSRSPKCTVIAQVSYGERGLAKESGFRWDRHNRVWSRVFKACDVDPEGFAFPVTVTPTASPSKE